jgi:general secretion pathway protein B
VDKPPAPTPPGAASLPPERAPSSTPPQVASAAGQDVIAKLRLQFLVYSDVPSERLVFINNRKYLEGQSVDGGVAVERITPEGAVLSYQGQRYVLRAESMGPR